MSIKQPNNQIKIGNVGTIGTSHGPTHLGNGDINDLTASDIKALVEVIQGLVSDAPKPGLEDAVKETLKNAGLINSGVTLLKNIAALCGRYM